MLFNSYTFLLLYLPAVFGGFLVLARLRLSRAVSAWLLLASLFFYGYWEPRYLLLLAVSIFWNYSISLVVAKRYGNVTLLLGVLGNIALLMYFKYTDFVLQNFAVLSNSEFRSAEIVLPLAISFFTFQQISYLVDIRRSGNAERNILNYALFVAFFPQLIAGPIVRGSELIPQIRSRQWMISPDHIARGIGFIVVGLFKKVALADSLAPTADALFGYAKAGGVLSVAEAWIAATAFTFQLYFDFSGYADIAIGLALLFSIHLPLNFNSPYKATSIVDFWRRWHMTLSHFLRDYLYIPLGGKGKREWTRARNLLITMLLGGLWHGAGWTYVVWGLWHGIGLTLNHFWRWVRGNQSVETRSPMDRLLSVGMTYIFVVFGWVLFRAEDLPTAASMMKSMAGLNGIDLPASLGIVLPLEVSGLRFEGTFPNQIIDVLGVGPALIFLHAAVWCLPNIQMFMGAGANMSENAGIAGVHRWWRWNPSYIQGGVFAVLMGISLLLMLGWQKQFVYFQF